MAIRGCFDNLDYGCHSAALDDLANLLAIRYIPPNVRCETAFNVRSRPIVNPFHAGGSKSLSYVAHGISAINVHHLEQGVDRIDQPSLEKVFLILCQQNNTKRTAVRIRKFKKAFV
ncbi:hypothetical protein [Bradyrhizobium cenepequi]|uniref:hypothetical protein n=1 Tax=Bradyrhizobium cenepequi TaxID=2821403 RepID=UPI001CE2C309|nr:hypothetical protein [Bradyrhizobium cenepequi]MCA6112512.1 hypothetical protein [Bradyrhizobium cenepequi]